MAGGGYMERQGGIFVDFKVYFPRCLHASFVSEETRWETNGRARVQPNPGAVRQRDLVLTTAWGGHGVVSYFFFGVFSGGSIRYVLQLPVGLFAQGGLALVCHQSFAGIVQYHLFTIG